MMNIDRELACEHYSHVKDKPFFNDMIDYITSGPVVVMVLSGYRVIEAVRSMVGATSNLIPSPVPSGVIMDITDLKILSMLQILVKVPK